MEKTTNESLIQKHKNYNLFQNKLQVQSVPVQTIQNIMTHVYTPNVETMISIVNLLGGGATDLFYPQQKLRKNDS